MRESYWKSSPVAAPAFPRLSLGVDQLRELLGDWHHPLLVLDTLQRPLAGRSPPPPALLGICYLLVAKLAGNRLARFILQDSVFLLF